MTNLTVFEFKNQSVRILTINGKPWFVAKDVLDAIGSSTTVTALKSLVCNDLGEVFVANQHLETAGGIQEMLILSEPALTLFVSRSRTELGKALNRWIHSEVLPAIRETGTYSVHTQPALTRIEMLAEIAQQMVVAERRQLEHERQLKEQADALAEIAANRLKAEEELAALPVSDTPAAEIPVRGKINKIVRSYVDRTHTPYPTIWSKLYSELYYRYKFDVKARCKNSGRKPLDEIEADGMLESLFAIASEVLV